jgi:hypothetical protein
LSNRFQERCRFTSKAYVNLDLPKIHPEVSEGSRNRKGGRDITSCQPSGNALLAEVHSLPIGTTSSRTENSGSICPVTAS